MRDTKRSNLTDEPIEEELKDHVDEIGEPKKKTHDDSVSKKVAQTVSNQYNIAMVDVKDEEPNQSASADLVVMGENSSLALRDKSKDKLP